MNVAYVVVIKVAVESSASAQGTMTRRLKMKQTAKKTTPVRLYSALTRVYVNVASAHVTRSRLGSIASVILVNVFHRVQQRNAEVVTEGSVSVTNVIVNQAIPVHTANALMTATAWDKMGAFAMVMGNVNVDNASVKPTILAKHVKYVPDVSAAKNAATKSV